MLIRETLMILVSWWLYRMGNLKIIAPRLLIIHPMRQLFAVASSSHYHIPGFSGA